MQTGIYCNFFDKFDDCSSLRSSMCRKILPDTLINSYSDLNDGVETSY